MDLFQEECNNGQAQQKLLPNQPGTPAEEGETNASYQTGGEDNPNNLMDPQTQKLRDEALKH